MIPTVVTCWTLIRSAATGNIASRDQFARLYEPVARASLAAHWCSSPCRSNLDDAVQDIFVECFKVQGALECVRQSANCQFRSFFKGIVRIVALRYEIRLRVSAPLPENHPNDDTSLSVAFDKAWARSVVKEAARVQAEQAAIDGERAVKRVELLRLRFQEGLPIREIAARWNEDPAKLHHEYATAREEFHRAILRVMAFHQPSATPEQLKSECRDLLNLLK